MIEEREEYLDSNESQLWSTPDKQFEFLTSQLVVYSTNKSLTHPDMLVNIVPQLPVSSIYYHFIDARRRLPDSGDDFRSWLAGWGEQYAELRNELAEIDPYFTTLIDLRQQISSTLQRCLGAA